MIDRIENIEDTLNGCGNEPGLKTDVAVLKETVRTLPDKVESLQKSVYIAMGATLALQVVIQIIVQLYAK